MSFKYTALCTQNVQPLLNAQYPLNIMFATVTFRSLFMRELRASRRVHVLLPDGLISHSTKLFFFQPRLKHRYEENPNILRISHLLRRAILIRRHAAADATIYLTRVMSFPHSHARNTSLGLRLLRWDEFFLRTHLGGGIVDLLSSHSDA